MDLVTKFQTANKCRSVKIGALEIERKYPIVSVQRVTKRYGSTVFMVLSDPTMSVIRVYLPRRYVSIVSNGDIVTTNAYPVAIER
jgi:hypothetical protein